MSRLAQGIEEACNACQDMKCEGCKIVVDIGDKVVTVNGKTHDILSVKLKEEVKKEKVKEACMNYSKGKWNFSKLARFLKHVACVVLLLLITHNAFAVEINIEKLADAIYKAEGGSKTSHPYGILKHYKYTTARQACINTIKHALKDFNEQGDFIEFLGSRYCPTHWENTYQATREEYLLNRYWVKNVKYFYNQ